MTLVSTTEKPVGDDSIRDAKHKGVKDALDHGITALGGDPSSKNSAGAIRDSIQKIFGDGYDADTHIETNYSRSIGRHSDQTICPLTVVWKTKIVILLPKNASDKMTKHEDGHQLIEEKVKELAKTRFLAASANIVNKNLTAAQVDAILDPISQKLMKIAVDASKSYDDVTTNGTDPAVDAAGQATAATNAFDAAAAANP